MLQWFRNLSVTIKATLLLSVTAALFVLALSLATYHFARKELQQSIATNQYAMVASLAKQLDQKLASARQYLIHLADHVLQHESETTNIASLQQLLDHHKEASFFFDAGLMLLSPAGTIIAAAPHDRQLIRQDRSYRDYFQQSLRVKGVYISAPYRALLPPHQPVITFSRAMYDKKGRVTGVLVGRHSLKDKGVLHALIDTPIGDSGYLYLINQQRTLLAHPDDRRVMTTVPPAANAAIDAALQGWSGTRENTNSQGLTGLTTIIKLQEVPWYLAAHYPLAEAYAPLHRAEKVYGLISAVTIFFMVAAIWFVMRPIINPLRQITSHLQQLSRKQGKDRFLPVISNDEFGQLSQVFNELLQELDDEAAAREKQSEDLHIISEFTIELALWRMTDGSVRFISSNCHELTDYHDYEFYAEPDLIDKLIHPDDRAQWLDHYQHDGNSHPPFQIRMVTKEGKIRWMRHTCHITRSSDGTVTGRRGNFSDATTVVEVQERLNQEKIFVENLIGSASTPLFVLDSMHNVIFWNRALESITGLLQEDIKGTNHHWQGFYPTQRPTLADLVLDGKTEIEGFYANYAPSKYVLGGYQAEGWFELNGTRRYLIFEAAPIKNIDGEVIAAIESFEDITERCLMEESVQRLTRAVEQTSSVIVITNDKGAIEYVNPRFCETTGYSVEEALGQNPRLLKSGEMSADSYADMWQTISSGKTWKGQFHNKRKNDELYWEAASISPLFDKEGQITGYLAVKEDITEQKAAREQLSEYRDQLEAKHIELEAAFKKIEIAKREWEETLDLLNDFIILTDGNHHIRRYNKILANLTGYGITELVGRDWRDLLQQSGFLFISFDGKRGELLHGRSNRTYGLSVYPIATNDIATGFVISLNDTTELRTATQELEEAMAELKEAQVQIFQQEKMASVGQLAAGVAHEINNPMGFISSNLGSLEKYVNRLTEYIGVVDQAMQGCCEGSQAAPVLDARKRLKIDHILDDAHQLIVESQDGAGRVRRIVQDLKSFSRVDQAETAFADLNEALETTINIAWNELKYVAELRKEFGDIPKVKCFPQQLNQVFLNLLVNAAHAMEGQQGTITVKTALADAGDVVVVSISDTGCGMTEEVRKRIFEPFYTTKEVGKGTGLGLSISYDIIKKHGGSIEVQSEPGRGTTFTIELPVSGEE
jgi:two-component system NtrC family sensor kinase